MKCALFPESLDPFIKGHLDTVERAAKLSDEVVIGALINTSKKSLLPPRERVALAIKTVSHPPNVEAMHRESRLTIEAAKEIGADTLTRGIRNIRDSEYERGIARMSRHLYDELKTVFLLAKPEYSHVSSSILRKVLHSNEDAGSYLPPVINEALAGKHESNES